MTISWAIEDENIRTLGWHWAILTKKSHFQWAKRVARNYPLVIIHV